MSIHWPIIRSLLRAPTRIAIVDDQREYRAIDLLVRAMHIASHISTKSHTSTIGLLLPTGGTFPLAALAGWMLGKTIVPINYLLKPEEMNYVIRDSGCDCIISVQPMLDFLGASAQACIFGDASSGAPVDAHTGVKHLVRLEDVSFKGVPDLFWPTRNEPDDIGVLLYTSGTSGKPKGVMLSHANIQANIRQIVNWVDFTHRDVVLGVLPQFHSFGLTVLSLLPLVQRAKVVYTARFVPNRIMHLIRNHRPSVMVAIPSMYNALLHVKQGASEDFASLRYIVSGGEPLPQAVFDGWRDRFNVTINEGYGLTETGPVSNWCRPEEWRRGSVGKPLPEMDQRIVNIDTGKPVGPNIDGEIRMKGPNVMRGYFHLPEETAKTFDEHGYFRTGDIGRFDEDGFLYITGRLKEMLIIGGENVFPREIEEVLNSHPSIKDSGVIGKHDPMRGEVPVAFIELKDDYAHAGAEGQTSPAKTYDERDVLKWCRSKLAGYKVPDEIRVVQALPRNATGKVVRRELKNLVRADYV